eukprot:2192387-Rhodomonas_salina.1
MAGLAATMAGREQAPVPVGEAPQRVAVPDPLAQVRARPDEAPAVQAHEAMSGTDLRYDLRYAATTASRRRMASWSSPTSRAAGSCAKCHFIPRVKSTPFRSSRLQTVPRLHAMPFDPTRQIVYRDLA